MPYNPTRIEFARALRYQIHHLRATDRTLTPRKLMGYGIVEAAATFGIRSKDAIHHLCARLDSRK